MAERAGHSLQGRVLLWLLLPALGGLLVNLALLWRDASASVNIAYDRTLNAAVTYISESVVADQSQIKVSIPYAAFELFAKGNQGRVFYVVADQLRRPLTGYADLTPLLPAAVDGFFTFTADFRGVPVRVGVSSKQLYLSDFDRYETATIAVAETIELRDSLVYELFIGDVWRQVLVLVLMVALVVLALRRAFRPLLRLQEAVAGRSDDNVEPLFAGDAPGEVWPLIETINIHNERYHRLLRERKRFITDAAHQLRTPLTLLRTQVDYGLKQVDGHEIAQALKAAQRNLDQAERLTAQLLSLSLAEAANAIEPQEIVLDLAELVRTVALECAPLAQQKGIDLAYHGVIDDSKDMLSRQAPMVGDVDQAAWVKGRALLLHELFANLIDNAIRYTANAGSVTLALYREVGSWRVNVMNQPAAIAEAERERVFERFYRLDSSNSEGSGLGLAIVREIALQHGGRVDIEPGNEAYKRVVVRVWLPRN